jgi:hypothetical protein
MSKSFSSPELIWDLEKSAYRIDDLSVGIGRDGTLDAAWVFLDSSGGMSNPVFFGWLPAAE